MKSVPALIRAVALRYETSLESATSRNSFGPAIARRAFMAPVIWEDLRGSAVDDAGQQRDTAVAGHREAGLDLLEVVSAVLGMPVPDLGIVLILVVGRVGAMQRHGGHVPAACRHIDAELADRAGPDAVGELPQVLGDGVQG